MDGNMMKAPERHAYAITPVISPRKAGCRLSDLIMRGEQSDDGGADAARDAVSECRDLLLPDELPKIVCIWLAGDQGTRARRGGHLSGAPARLGTGSLPDSI
jgi:hypothetical protein